MGGGTIGAPRWKGLRVSSAVRTFSALFADIRRKSTIFAHQTMLELCVMHFVTPPLRAPR